MESKIKVDGSVAFWTLTDKTDRVTLETGLKDIGLQSLMPPMRPGPAILRDALQDACGNARTLIRPLGDRRGFAVVDEVRGATTNSYLERFTVKAQDLNGSIGLEFGGNYHNDSAKVRLSCAEWHGIASSDQVANVLVRAVAMFSGISLRPSGAIYWIPGSAVNQWTALGRVIENAGGGSRVYRISHDFDDEAVKAVRDAVIHEIQSETQRIEDDVMNGDLGKRALESRELEAQAMRAKVQLYQGLLSTGLDALTTHLDALEQSIATASLMASAIDRKSSPALV